MNQNLHITNQAELERLIERYFDGETCIQEEQMLRATLADCPWSSEVIDEARFTMGFFAAHSQETERVAKRATDASSSALRPRLPSSSPSVYRH